MERAQEWLGGSEARYNNINHCWAFPSGATLAFGNLEHEQDKFRYQSAEFHYIGFDELTQFTETQYRYLFSRLRRLSDSPIPLRMRAASNPGNVGHDWVKSRFMPWFRCLNCGEQQQVSHAEKILECPKCKSTNVETVPTERRIFIPAKLDDNPSLDRERYIESLSELDPITRRQYLDGDWTARHGGSIFLREWFKIVREAPSDLKKVRFWDKASTEPKPQNKDPDWTAGLLLGTRGGQYWILDVKRTRSAPPLTEQLIKQTADLDELATPVFMEQEPGSSGVDTIDYYNRKVLMGFEFRGVKTSGPKTERAGPVSSAAEAGNVFVVQGPWNSAFLDEVEAFPDGAHDDQVDALSGAFSKVRGPIEVSTGKPPW